MHAICNPNSNVFNIIVSLLSCLVQIVKFDDMKNVNNQHRTGNRKLVRQLNKERSLCTVKKEEEVVELWHEQGSVFDLVYSTFLALL